MKGLHRARRPAPAPLYPIVFRWDLDKTYLKSDFERLSELVRIPFQKPEDKVTVPGVVPLIRSLRAVAAQAGREVRIYFMSASPPQIGKAIKEKLALDGIEYDGIVFKNQLQHLVRGKFRNLREHVGYKLTELLKGRHAVPADAREVLFGDDWESDPIIYSLYADLLAGRIDPQDLGEVLTTIGVDAALIAEAKALAADAPGIDVVTKIYINIERNTPPTQFRFFGARLVPSFNYFQTAACLFEDGYLTLPAVAEVAAELLKGPGFTPHRLANSLADIARRGHLQPSSRIAVREYLRARNLFPQRMREAPPPSLWHRMKQWWERKPPPRPAVDETINYHTLVTEWRAAR
jgi:uncharacterized protein DUF2183